MKPDDSSKSLNKITSEDIIFDQYSEEKIVDEIYQYVHGPSQDLELYLNEEYQFNDEIEIDSVEELDSSTESILNDLLNDIIIDIEDLKDLESNNIEKSN